MHHSKITIKLLRVTYNHKLYPGRGKHVVDESTFMITPVEANLPHLVSNQIVICVDQSIHVAVQTLQTVNSFYVKLNLHKVLRISADDEVDVVPVR